MKKVMIIMILTVYAMALFAQDSKMSEIKISELPKGVSTWVDKNSPGSKITRAGKIVDKGVLSYIAVVDMKGQKRALQFDKDGKFIGKADNMFNGQGQKPPATKAEGVKAVPAGTTTDPKQQGTPTAKPPVKTQDLKATTTTTDEAPKK